MADQYIENQKKIIKRRIKKVLPGHLIALGLLLLILGVILYGTDPPPSMWKTDEITIVDIQYRSRARTLARYASPGYEVMDQNGNLYWSGREITWEEIGETYTIKYFVRGSYRRLQAVSHGDTVIISEVQKTDIWERDFSICMLLLIFCMICIIRQLRALHRDLHHPEIVACKNYIRIHEAKLARRASERRRK